MLNATRLSLAILALLAAAVAAHAQNPAVGTWAFTTQSPEGEFKSTLVIREEGGKLVAVGKNPQGERPYDKVTVDGTKITLVITIDYQGTPMVITYAGAIADAKMSGEADFGGLATGTWSATAQQ